MNLNINTSMDFTKERVEKTRAVQESLTTTASWTWPSKTLAQWDADLAQLEGGVSGTLAQKALGSAAAYDVKRADLETRYTTIKRRTLQGVGVMRARALQDAELRVSVDELSARGDSFRAIEDEGEELMAVWKEEFGITFTPAPGNTFAEFEKLFVGAAGPPVVTSLRALKTAHKAARVLARKDAGKLAALINRLDDECIAWYKEATAVFPKGTDEGDLIRAEVPTIDDYNPPGGEPPEPPAVPATPQNVTFTQASPGQPVVANADAVTGATLYKMYSRFIGAPEAPALVHSSATLPANFVATPNEFEFTMTASNAGGESAPSAVVTLSVE